MPKALRLFKRVNGMRQIEMAETMVSANNFVAGYAEALVLGTPKHQLANPDEPKRKRACRLRRLPAWKVKWNRWNGN